MNLTPYVEALAQDLAAAAEVGGPDARAAAERLVSAMESGVRLMLLDALSAAASEITRDLAPGSVELRLRDREPSFVVTLPPGETQAVAAQYIPNDSDDSAMTRINLRLGQDLKDRVDNAAREAGISVNSWLVRAATAGLGTGEGVKHTPGGSSRYTGWVH